ncbi:MAG: hypothetical protein H6591_03490 [Flavobacteriales bacterium]|nr:hypothetical protein [Flavobacteriales bacterium]
MKTVILGAGASYDSVHQFFERFDGHQYQPPLTNGLFQLIPEYEKLYQVYPGVRALLSELRAATNIEEYFQEQWNFAVKYRATELMAQLVNVQFYLQQLLFDCSQKWSNAGPSNYDTVVRWAYRYSKSTGEPVQFISFNYDLLLEGALKRQYGLPQDELSIDDYVANEIKLLKPHGSCNWYRTFRDPITAPNKWSSAQALYHWKYDLDKIESMLSPEIHAEPRIRNHALEHGQKGWFPQLVIPLRDKDSFVMPPQHLQIMKRHLSGTDEVLVIGWKAQEQEFQRTLAECCGNRQLRVTLVCHSSGKAVQRTLSSVLPKATFSIRNEDAVVSHEMENGDIGSMSLGPGGFASYVINVQSGRVPNFFG